MISGNSAKGEVAGSFLLGLIESFYHLSVLPQGGVNLHQNDIDPEQWYPHSVLIDTLYSIDQAVPSSSNIFFRAGINFVRIWYENGPGKKMINSGRDWLHAHSESQGYNSVVRGGKPNEVGWSLLQSFDEDAGIASYENVMPLSPDFVRGVFYGGCILFDDMEYVDVDTVNKPYPQNPLFNKFLLTVRFRSKSNVFSKKLEERINNLQLGSIFSPTPKEVESLVWRLKGLQAKISIDSAYYSDINNILAEAVTTTQKQRDEIAHLSNHDALTGLPNLRLARDRLKMACEQAIRNKKSTALLFIDIDKFKQINDTFGHEAGDYVLKAAAERISGCVRNVDTVARLGGDEFIVILNDITGIDAATLVAIKIITLISEPFYHNDHLLKIGSSIGIALFPDNATDPKDLLKKADNAMYLAKHSVKNNFVVYSGT